MVGCWRYFDPWIFGADTAASQQNILFLLALIRADVKREVTTLCCLFVHMGRLVATLELLGKTQSY